MLVFCEELMLVFCAELMLVFCEELAALLDQLAILILVI